MAKPDPTKEMQARVDLLMQENDQLRRKLFLLSGGGPQGGSLSLANLTSFGGGMHQTRAPQATIAGLSVAYLIVDKSWRVTRMNTRMAEFLNVPKGVADGKPALAEIDSLEWAPGVFITLLQDALNSDGEEVFEAERPNAVRGRSEYFQFKAVWSAGHGTVTVEDVTRLRQTRQFFERLVSPRIVEQLLDTGEDPFGTGKRKMTVLFGDLRNFTNFCETVEGTVVQQVVNDFVEAAIRAIDANDATLDKFVGDQVMVLFGAPLANSGHAYNAVKLAVDLQTSMQQVRARWLANNVVPAAVLAKHPEILSVGIGINTGEMLLGMFGSDRSNQYTVLGHHVNLASRLCSFAAGNEVLATLGTVHEISTYAKENPNSITIPIKFRTKAQIEVKGIAEPVTVATLAYNQQGAHSQQVPQAPAQTPGQPR
ncbi:MAG: adenylate/guanylate cyclase domain-containing protein [Planctomycetes bacterium]|nr:adenylate/guanylate cyclase domain-containing protein [Planctomycetota bacterium]